jgi:zinc protease
MRRTIGRTLGALALWAGLWTGAAALAEPAATQASGDATARELQMKKTVSEAPVTVPVDLGQARKRAEGLVAGLRAGDAGLQLVDVQPFGSGVVEHWKLGNGLRVLVAADPQAPVVAVHTWVAVGSAGEVPGKTGLAHLLEHLMFKSTKTRPAGTFDRLLEQMGASANAATWLDWTYYHEVVPPQHLATVLELEADRLANLDLSATAFKAELDVVKNERREHVENDPDGILDEAVQKAAYGNHPYGHPTLGWAEDLDKLELADVLAFHARHYAPNRITLVLVGAVETEAALREVIARYGRLPPGAPVVEPKLPPLTSRGTETTLTLDAHAERLALAWPTVFGMHPDHAALSVLTEVLFNADSARLQRGLMFDSSVASDVEASLGGLRHTSLLDVRVAVMPGRTARQALQLLDAGLAALLGDRPVTDDEVRGAKNRLKMDHYRELTGVDGRAETLGDHQTTFGDAGTHSAWWQAVASVTTADVQRVARTYLVNDRRVVVLGVVPAPQVVENRAGRKIR